MYVLLLLSMLVLLLCYFTITISIHICHITVLSYYYYCTIFYYIHMTILLYYYYCYDILLLLQPLTIRYCQDDLRMFRVNLVAAMCYVHSFTDQTPHSSCHGEAENHFPRSVTPRNKNQILSSEMILDFVPPPQC